MATTSSSVEKILALKNRNFSNETDKNGGTHWTVATGCDGKPVLTLKSPKGAEQIDHP